MSWKTLLFLIKDWTGLDTRSNACTRDDDDCTRVSSASSRIIRGSDYQSCNFRRSVDYTIHKCVRFIYLAYLFIWSGDVSPICACLCDCLVGIKIAVRTCKHKRLYRQWSKALRITRQRDLARPSVLCIFNSGLHLSQPVTVSMDWYTSRARE